MMIQKVRVCFFYTTLAITGMVIGIFVGLDMLPLWIAIAVPIYTAIVMSLFGYLAYMEGAAAADRRWRDAYQGRLESRDDHGR